MAPVGVRPASKIVALAASAGGLNALTRVLSALPADFAAPVLVVQHLDPHHRSFMAEILRRGVSMPVGQACAGDRIEPGKIFIAPPDRHLLVSADGALVLSEAPREQFVRPSADLLFSSLAEVYGAGVIAVVLTGTGRDGAKGVTAVHERGGTVIVQDHASSAHAGMPDAAVNTGKADFVLTLEAIAEVLISLTAQRES